MHLSITGVSAVRYDATRQVRRHSTEGTRLMRTGGGVGHCHAAGPRGLVAVLVQLGYELDVTGRGCREAAALGKSLQSPRPPGRGSSGRWPRASEVPILTHVGRGWPRPHEDTDPGAGPQDGTLHGPCSRRRCYNALRCCLAWSGLCANRPAFVVLPKAPIL